MKFKQCLEKLVVPKKVVAQPIWPVVWRLIKKLHGQIYTNIAWVGEALGTVP